MASEPEQTYLAVLKASYNYEPAADAEDELPISEDQLLFLLERTDEEYVRDPLFLRLAPVLTISKIMVVGGKSRSRLTVRTKMGPRGSFPLPTSNP